MHIVCIYIERERKRLVLFSVFLLVHYLKGKRCQADLLADGLIQWNGSRYSSPYAWASQCKNQVNPDHKSGIGWGHVSWCVCICDLGCVDKSRWDLFGWFMKESV